MKLRCPYCSQKMTTDGELETGTPIDCPKCAKTFKVSAGNLVDEKLERELAAKAAPPPRPQAAPPAAPNGVKITGISIPFLDMVLLLIEIALAAIPALLVLYGIFYMITMILGRVH